MYQYLTYTGEQKSISNIPKIVLIICIIILQLSNEPTYGNRLIYECAPGVYSAIWMINAEPWGISRDIIVLKIIQNQESANYHNDAIKPSPHFFVCYERDCMCSLSINDENQMIDAGNNSSRYFDDILNLDNPFLTKFQSI